MNEKLRDYPFLHQLVAFCCFFLFFGVWFSFQLPGGTEARIEEMEEGAVATAWELLTFFHSTHSEAPLSGVRHKNVWL